MYYIFVLLTITLYSTTQVFGTEICPNSTKMQACVKDAESDWDIDRNKKDNYKSWCCFQRDAYECQMALGRVCQPGHYDTIKFNVSMTAIHEDLEKDCHEFPIEKCSGLQWWAITLIVIASIAVVAILGFLVFVLLSRRRRRYSAPK